MSFQTLNVFLVSMEHKRETFNNEKDMKLSSFKSDDTG